MRGRTQDHSTPPPRARSVPAIGSVLPGALARLGLAEGVERWRAVTEWETIVGESLARHSWARRVDGATLVVETDDAYGLSHQKPGLLKLVRDYLGSDCIRELRLENKRN